jgi:diguanylate cyclase (GGDEF)-like protein
VLRVIARLFKDNLRNSDVVARWGGEEFLFLMPHTNLDAAIHTAEKIKKIVGETDFSHEEKTFGVTMSFGLAQYQPKDTFDSVLTRADHALYMAKEKGRNQVSKL